MILEAGLAAQVLMPTCIVLNEFERAATSVSKTQFPSVSLKTEALWCHIRPQT